MANNTDYDENLLIDLLRDCYKEVLNDYKENIRRSFRELDFISDDCLWDAINRTEDRLGKRLEYNDADKDCEHTMIMLSNLIYRRSLDKSEQYRHRGSLYKSEQHRLRQIAKRTKKRQKASMER